MLPDLWYAQTRPTEIGLTILCLGYGLYLTFIPEAAYASQILSEIAWLGYGPLIGLPFFLKAIFTGWGVTANIYGLPYSRFFRCFGACIGSSIWGWTILQDYDADKIVSFISFVCAIFILSSLWVFTMSLANLPRPGTTSKVELLMEGASG